MEPRLHPQVLGSYREFQAERDMDRQPGGSTKSLETNKETPGKKESCVSQSTAMRRE